MTSCNNTIKSLLLYGLPVWALFIWFDVEWCLMTTFTAFSKPGLYIFSLLWAWILAWPGLAKGAPRLQAVINTLLALLLLSNLMYYRTYFKAIPVGSYLLVGNLGDFTSSVYDSVRWADLGLLVIVAWSWIVAFRHKVTHLSKRTYILTGMILLALSVGWILILGGWKNAWKNMEKANVYACRVPVFTVPGWLIHDAMTGREPLTAENLTTLKEWWAEHPRPQGLPAGIQPRKSMVIVFCESLESWPVGLKVEGKEVMPFLNRMVADTVHNFYAPKVVSQVGDGRSIDAQLLLNAGLRPRLSGVFAYDNADNDYLTLNRAIGGKSYLLSVDKPSTWNQQGVARAFGIDTMLVRDAWRNDEPVGSRKKTGDRSFMRQTTEKMHRGEIFPIGEEAYIQLVTYSGHQPWELPQNLDELALKGDYMPEIKRYLSTANYTDRALQILVEYIMSRPDSKDIMIVITGDHEGLAQYRAEASKRHSWVASAPLVPFIVINSPVGGKFTGYAGQTDIYPTLLDMLGKNSYPWTGVGISMLSDAHPRAATGSDGQLYAPRDCSNFAILQQNLNYARKASDLILNHNLLQQLIK